MSKMFENYEQEFTLLTKAASAKIALVPNTRGGAPASLPARAFR